MFRLIGKLIKICILGVAMLFIATFIVSKFNYQGGEPVKITDTTKVEQSTNQQPKEEEEVKQAEDAKQKEFNQDTERVLQEQKQKQNEKHYTKASDVWTDDNGKNVVQPNIDKQEKAMKNHDKNAPFENPTASGKSFLGDDIK